MNLQEKLNNDIAEWIFKWVSQHNENLKAVPCPFAKQAYIDDKISIRLVEPLSGYSVEELIEENLSNLVIQNWPEDKEVVIIGCQPELVSANEFEKAVAECNDEILIPHGYIALEDHPDSPEIIAGESMNQGSWALILVQKFSKLNQASKMLERQGYYDTWSEQNLEDVVCWRPE